MPSYDLATKAQAIVMLALCQTLLKITLVTGICSKHIKNLYRQAIERGWEIEKPLLNQHLLPKPGRGRKRKITPEIEERIISMVTQDRYGR
jgi:hypothetical protein